MPGLRGDHHPTGRSRLRGGSAAAASPKFRRPSPDLAGYLVGGREHLGDFPGLGPGVGAGRDDRRHGDSEQLGADLSSDGRDNAGSRVPAQQRGLRVTPNVAACCVWFWKQTGCCASPRRARCETGRASPTGPVGRGCNCPPAVPVRPDGQRRGRHRRGRRSAAGLRLSYRSDRVASSRPGAVSGARPLLLYARNRRSGWWSRRSRRRRRQLHATLTQVGTYAAGSLDYMVERMSSLRGAQTNLFTRSIGTAMRLSCPHRAAGA